MSNAARIHPTAIIDPHAVLADDVRVGAYAIIGPQVTIGAGSTIGPHAVIEGHTGIGARNRVFAHAVLGGVPQDKKYADENTQLLIGDDNTIREFCTVNTGTVQDGGVTRIGSHNWIMAYVHVAHDVQLGSHTILANCVQLAGHVHVGDWAIVGGLSGVHQFVHIGAHAMAGAGTTLLQDLPPFVICNGNPASAHGMNLEGLRRRGFSAAQLAALRRAYRTVYKDGLTAAAACDALDAQAAEDAECAEQLHTLAQFIRGSKRGIVR
jgi:UDP-N-acetylglucosamine acyltransferase